MLRQISSRFLFPFVLVALYRMKKFLIGFVILSVLIAIAVYISSWNMRRSTINMYNKYAPGAPYDVIIVPGLPYDSSKQNILLKVRMFWAKDLFDKGIARNIIFSGGAVHTAWVEGMAMKTMADSMGIPPDHTFVEDRAEHSNENVYFSWKLAQKMGFKKIALATDQYQNYFLVSFIEKRMSNIALLPVSVDSFPVYSKKMLPVINACDACVKSFVPLEDRESRFQRVRSAFNDEIEEPREEKVSGKE